MRPSRKALAPLFTLTMTSALAGTARRPGDRRQLRRHRLRLQDHGADRRAVPGGEPGHHGQARHRQLPDHRGEPAGAARLRRGAGRRHHHRPRAASARYYPRPDGPMWTRTASSASSAAPWCWLRGSDQTGAAINGMPTSLTVNGAYVNLTLFEQAGVPRAGRGRDLGGLGRGHPPGRRGHRHRLRRWRWTAPATASPASPSATGPSSWTTTASRWWTTASRRRSSSSRPGTRTAPCRWTSGARSAASTHRELFSDFVNANAVLYFGGSWTLSQMDTEVGDFFDWAVVAGALRAVVLHA